jgi:hypothetical protein
MPRVAECNPFPLTSPPGGCSAEYEKQRVCDTDRFGKTTRLGGKGGVLRANIVTDKPMMGCREKVRMGKQERIGGKGKKEGKMGEKRKARKGCSRKGRQKSVWESGGG